MRASDFLCALAPIVIGALAGLGLGRWHGRLGGVWLLPVIPIASMALGLAFVSCWPVIGLWDALFEGFLAGVAFAWAGHRLFADWRASAVVLSTLALALGGLEVFARTTLPPAPTFSSGLEAHLFLADALASTPLPGDGVTTELVCSLAYGPRYTPLVDLSRDDVPARSRVVDVPRPGRFVADPARKRRVLHVGDSMVYGVGVPRDQTFAALLDATDPVAQHINAGIPATAPDDYLTVARAWLREGPHVDLAVMYILDLNDVDDMDSPHRCTAWQSLFTYDTGTAQLRFPDGPHAGGRDLRWLQMISPPPYFFRLLKGRLASAAFLTAPMMSRWFDSQHGGGTHWAHLKVVLSSAATELKQRGTALAIVYLPARWAVEDRLLLRYEHIPEPAETLATELGVPVLDPLPQLAAAAARGEHLFVGEHDFHFNEAGHRLMARWLREQLAGAFPPVRGGASSPAGHSPLSAGNSDGTAASTSEK